MTITNARICPQPFDNNPQALSSINRRCCVQTGKPEVVNAAKYTFSSKKGRAICDTGIEALMQFAQHSRIRARPTENLVLVIELAGNAHSHYRRFWPSHGLPAT
ncbi:MAG: hypothetical protein U0X75_21860 [Acidobacteriota bacterium]